MTDSVQFRLEGVDQLVIRLRNATKETKYRGGRAALRKAATTIARQVRANAKAIDDPETGRSIARNVATRWNGRHFKRTGDIAFRVGIRQGAVLKDGGDPSTGAPTPHWRLLEFGTEKMRARPFMRLAMTQKQSEAISTFATEYMKELNKAIR